MKIKVWSDFVCPFCYIGKRHLEEALRETGIEAEIEMKSYELDPSFAERGDVSIHELLANKYGISLEEARANNQRVGMMAQQAGLHYDFSKMRYSNTFSAHKLLQYAKEKGKGNELTEALMHAYFSEGAYLQDTETLMDLVQPLGIEHADVERILKDTVYDKKVHQDEQEAHALGVRGVPFFQFENGITLSGAQPVETFKQTVNYLRSVADASAPSCDDGACQI